MKKFNFHVKPIGLLDMLHFKKMVPRRRAILQSGSLEPITAVYGVNRLAQSLHPKQQKAVVAAIIPRKDAKTYVLKADKPRSSRARTRRPMCSRPTSSPISAPGSTCPSS